MAEFVLAHPGQALILIVTILVFVALLILVPQLLRANLRKAEMLHLEQMKSLENGQPIMREDDRSKVAGRTAMLVPMVVVICAGAVTCYLSAFATETLTTVALTVWVVAGIVSLAAITGGVSLIGRLAQLHSGDATLDEEPEEESIGAPRE